MSTNKAKLESVYKSINGTKPVWTQVPKDGQPWPEASSKQPGELNIFFTPARGIRFGDVFTELHTSEEMRSISTALRLGCSVGLVSQYLGADTSPTATRSRLSNPKGRYLNGHMVMYFHPSLRHPSAKFGGKSPMAYAINALQDNPVVALAGDITPITQAIEEGRVPEDITEILQATANRESSLLHKQSVLEGTFFLPFSSGAPGAPDTILSFRNQAARQDSQGTEGWTPNDSRRV